MCVCVLKVSLRSIFPVIWLSLPFVDSLPLWLPPLCLSFPLQGFCDTICCFMTFFKKTYMKSVVSGLEKGVITKGVFSLEESLESLESLNSLESRKWSDSPCFSTVWGFSKISRISKFFRISGKWTFLKRPLFQKTPFSEPDRGKCHLLS